jgi:TonB family protein
VGVFLATASLPAHALQAPDSTVATQPGADQGGVQILTKLNAKQLRIMHKYVTHKMMVATYRAWIPLVPEEAKSPMSKKGSVAIEFTLHPDGTVSNMRLAEVSGDVALDRAAWGGVVGAKYAPLPAGLNVPELTLRFHFIYNGGEAGTTRPPTP